MSAKIRYTDEDIGEPLVIPDFLPPPDQLVFREESVKVTITLSKKSVDFFKLAAAKSDTQYQRMIRRLLDIYVDGQVAMAASRRRAPTRTKVARSS